MENYRKQNTNEIGKTIIASGLTRTAELFNKNRRQTKTGGYVKIENTIRQA